MLGSLVRALASVPSCLHLRMHLRLREQAPSSSRRGGVFADSDTAAPTGGGYSCWRAADAYAYTHTQMHTRVPDVIVMRTLLPGFSPVGRSEALALAPGVGVGAGLIAYGQLAVIMH